MMVVNPGEIPARIGAGAAGAPPEARRENRSRPATLA